MRWSLLLFLALTACQPHYTERTCASLIMQKNDRLLAQDGFYEFMTIEPKGTLIGDFKKHYITKRYRITEVDQGRILFCTIMDELLRPFNNEQGLRPFLKNYPLTFQDIELQIVFVDERDFPLIPPYLCSIRKVGEMLYYEQYDQKMKKSVAYAMERADRAFRIFYQMTQGKL